MKQLSDLTDDELWDAAIDETGLLQAEAAARAALTGAPVGEGDDDWYVAPGCNPALYLAHIGQHAAEIGEQA